MAPLASGAPFWRAMIPSQKLMAGIVIGWVTMFLVGAHLSEGLLSGSDSRLGRGRNFDGTAFTGGAQLVKEGMRLAQQGRKLRSGESSAVGGQEDERSAEQRETERLLWNATILVGMAAFRDPECQDSVWLALANAANIDRVSIAVYQQHAPDDPDCLQWAKLMCPPQDAAAIGATPEDERRRRPSFAAGPEEVTRVCAALPRVNIQRVDAFTDGKGPTVGRHHMQKMLKDEEFFFQVDSHSHFIYGWDVEIMRNWRHTGNPRAVITTYPVPHDRIPGWLKQRPMPRPSSALPYPPMVVDPVTMFEYLRVQRPLPSIPGFELKYLPRMVPIICHVSFTSMAGNIPRLEAAGYLSIQQGQPIRTPFWAAGLAFSTAEAVREVPYDLYTPYLFDGEEISTAARLWTHGYDFYAPITDTVFHVYESAYKRNKYWEIDWQERSAIQMRSSQRIAHILGFNVSSDFDDSELDKYGLGTNRTIEEYWRFAGINMTALTSENLCQVLESGRFPSQEKRPHGFVDYESIPSHPEPPLPGQVVALRRHLQQDAEERIEEGPGGRLFDGGRHEQGGPPHHPVGKSAPKVRQRPDHGAEV